jgi:nucleoid-associated protein YgaU
LKDFLKNLKLNEGNLGMALGVVVMVLAGFLLLNYFRSINRPSGQTSSTSTELPASTTPSTDSTQGKLIQPKPGGEYVVQRGDSLWKISMKTYGTGYLWNKIYDANRDTVGSNPSLLVAGTRLNLPDTQPIEYTVHSGDNLWNISQTYCGSGSSWQGIATANNLANPRVIQPGLVLKISCK